MDTASIEVRKLTIDDYQQLKDSMIQAYASLGGQYWKNGLTSSNFFDESIRYSLKIVRLQSSRFFLSLMFVKFGTSANVQSI